MTGVETSCYFSYGRERAAHGFIAGELPILKRSSGLEANKGLRTTDIERSLPLLAVLALCERVGKFLGEAHVFRAGNRKWITPHRLQHVA